MESVDRYIARLAQHGLTDQSYLRVHYSRYRETHDLFRATWDPARQGRRLLDIGAHWLHQAVMYADDGFEVTAADLPVTFDYPSVRALAEAYGITLLQYPDLRVSNVFSRLPDNRFDVVLFTEIIEHLTFNPVAMWREIYRVLSPGGRIVVTTPNYYYPRGRAWQLWRFLRLRGGGIPVEDILKLNDYAHHWKEFSMRELAQYFALLSPDFVVSKKRFVLEFWRNEPRAQSRILMLYLGLQKLFPLLRPNLHIEVDLPEKRSGITVAPA